MAKIYKSNRKIVKTKQEIYIDAMIKFWRSLDHNKKQTSILSYNTLKKKWIHAGGSKKTFTTLGLKKVAEILKQRGKI